MESNKREVSLEVPPYLKVYTDGSVERLFGYEIAPAGFDPLTGVTSKDVIISPGTAVSARLYRPTLPSDHPPKLPLVVYFHGGAFFFSSFADPKYHHSLNKFVSVSKVVLISVNYRKAPEFPLPTCYEDSRAALTWVAEQISGKSSVDRDPWLKDVVDSGSVFIAGDSAGANIAHHMSMLDHPGLDLAGMIMINPYFWGEEPVGSEAQDTVRREMVNGWWRFVCQSEKGCDDPLINPFAGGAPDVSGVKCERVIVCVAGKDILRDRGRLYYEELGSRRRRGESGGGKVEMVEIEGEDHVFHIMDPSGVNAIHLFSRLASFIYYQS